MNIVVVTKYESDISKFIRDASDWVMKNPVDKTLYRYSGVGANRNVRIGPYNIMFARRPEVLLGLRIDIVYYYGISKLMLTVKNLNLLLMTSNVCPYYFLFSGLGVLPQTKPHI